MSYTYAHGTGTAEDPYQVWTAADLDGVRDHLDAYFIQMADIDLSSWGNWTPIGGIFTGIYSGNNMSILNMSIIVSSGNMMGLFYALNGAKVTDLTITNGHVENTVAYGGSYYGILTGYAYGNFEITDCHIVNGYVKVGNHGGGFGGHVFNGKYLKCSSQIEIETNSYGGGFVGEVQTVEFDECYSHSTVRGIDSDPIQFGVFVASTEGSSYTNCYARGQIVGSWSLAGTWLEWHVGGFGAGLTDNVFTNCYSSVYFENDNATIGEWLHLTAPFFPVYYDEIYNEATNCYYDNDVHKLPVGFSDDHASPRTTAEMVYPYIDFPANVYTNWFFCENGTGILNDGYPLFIWQIPIWKHDKDHKVNDGYPYFCWWIPPILVSTCVPFLFKVPKLV